MLLAANRRSTGIGVRPRGNRIEVTADFTPDAALMAATATLIVGIVRAVMEWPSYELERARESRFPSYAASRRARTARERGGSRARAASPANPFTSDVNTVKWTTRAARDSRCERWPDARRDSFWDSIRALGDPVSLQLIAAVMRGRAPSMLELPDRPAAYEDVGRLCRWDDLFPLTLLPRSRYERVLSHAVSGRRVRMDGSWHRPVAVRGWTHIVFRRESDGARRVMSLDEMLAHLDAWDRTADRRASQRRVYRVARAIERRLVEDRRAAISDVEQLRRRESDFASLDAELPPPEPKSAERPIEKRVVVERETPVPLSAESHGGEKETSAKPAKRKRRQREGPPKPRTRRAKGDDDETNPRA